MRITAEPDGLRQGTVHTTTIERTGAVERTDPADRHVSWTTAGPVISHLPEAGISALEERSMATIADPSTLGLWGFATGTWIVATVLAGDLPLTSLPGTAMVVLIFGGIVQFIAGLYAFRRANALTATAFCCFGAFNATAAATVLLQATGLLPPGGGTLVFQGYLLESFGFIALALTFAALRVNLVLVGVLATLCVGYVLSGIPDFGVGATAAAGRGAVGAVGGYFLMASAFLAYYLGMALAVNSSWKRRVLPIFGEP